MYHLALYDEVRDEEYDLTNWGVVGEAAKHNPDAIVWATITPVVHPCAMVDTYLDTVTGWGLLQALGRELGVYWGGGTCCYDLVYLALDLRAPRRRTQQSTLDRCTSNE